MNIIIQNPFRVLGLLGNATEREIQKQIAIIKRFAQIEQIKAFHYDFEILGSFKRDLNTAQKASNMIENSNKKLFYSLFWFINNHNLDEIALNYLSDKNIDKALEIWQKALKNDITDKNFSIFLNISTLYMIISLNEPKINLPQLKKAITLKIKLILSDSFGELSKLITNTKININPIDIGKNFIDEMIEEFKIYINNNQISMQSFISLFSEFPDELKQYLINEITSIPVSIIESKIENTTQKRKNNTKKSVKFATNLYFDIKNDLDLLKNIMGENNIKYKTIVNKLADEILDCAIVGFNENVDDADILVAQKAVKILTHAKTLNPAKQIFDRIEKNQKNIQEWIEDAPTREQLAVVENDIIFITKAMTEFRSKANSFTNATNLINSCLNKLINMEKHLGCDDETYLEISTAVARCAFNMSVDILNNSQKLLIDRQISRYAFSQDVNSCLLVFTKIEKMNKTKEFQKVFRENSNAIREIKQMIERPSQNIIVFIVSQLFRLLAAIIRRFL